MGVRGRAPPLLRPAPLNDPLQLPPPSSPSSEGGSCFLLQAGKRAWWREQLLHRGCIRVWGGEGATVCDPSCWLRACGAFHLPLWRPKVARFGGEGSCILLQAWPHLFLGGWEATTCHPAACWNHAMASPLRHLSFFGGGGGGLDV